MALKAMGMDSVMPFVGSGLGWMSNRPWNTLKPKDGDPKPFYLQIAQNLARAINAGEWQAEEALPSERVLASKLGVSRDTTRKAIDLLLRQKLLQRKDGETVIAPRLEQPLTRLSNLTEMLKVKGFVCSSKWLDRKIDVPTPNEMLKLGLARTSQVTRLERLRMADLVVIAVERTTIPAALLPDPDAVGGSLYEHLAKSGHNVVRALQHFRAVNASRRIARLARIEVGEPILLVTRVGFDENDMPIEFTESYCRNEYYDFVAELRR